MWDVCTQNTFNICTKSIELKLVNTQYEIYIHITDIIPWWEMGETFVNNPLATCLPPCTKTCSMKHKSIAVN